MLFSASNHAEPTQGTPPEVNADDPNLQVAYLTNENGVQLIYVFDKTTTIAKLYRSSDGWENPAAVDLLPCKVGVQLSQAEYEWLCACTNISQAIV